MIQYKLIKYKNQGSEYNGHYYAKADHEETVDLDGLVEHMASHNTPFSKGTINGVLKDMVVCIRELCLESKQVKIDDLAIFGLGLKACFVPDIASFNASSHIKGAHICARGTGDFAFKSLKLDVKYKEKKEYSKE